MELELNRKITAKEYTSNNIKKEWCIREHNYGVYKFTDGYIEWLEFNYVKYKEMRKLIDIPQEIIKPLKILAVKNDKDLKNYIQDLLSEHVKNSNVTVKK